MTEGMNIGSLRLAILNHIISKRLDEDLIIRIEDLDKENNIEEQDEEIIRIIDLFSIDYKYIVHQSENEKFHNQMARQLNKTPTHNFACAVDDMLLDISTIIIDTKHKDKVDEQIEIRKALGYTKDINYIYIPAMTNESEIGVLWLISEGYLPAAIANYLVELSYDIPEEIFTLEEAIQNFDINRISDKTTTFEIDRLQQINKEYLESIDNMRLSKLIGYADEDIGKLAKLYLSECYTIKQLKYKIDTIFNKKELLDQNEDKYTELYNSLEKAPFFNKLEDLKKYIKQNTSLDDDSISTILRYAITGNTNGPELSEIYPLIKNYLGVIV
jgi:glutamyl-tRNA synthetase